MRIKGDKPPSLAAFSKQTGVDRGLARAYQKTLGLVKARMGAFAKMTEKLFPGSKGMHFADPTSVYQMNFRKSDTPQMRNDYVMARLVELQQMNTFQGLAGMHQEKLDNYMANVAAAMERNGYSPEQVQRFTQKYAQQKQQDINSYMKGKHGFSAWEFVSLTGGASITLRYMTHEDLSAQEEATLDYDISEFEGAIAEYIGGL